MSFDIHIIKNSYDCLFSRSFFSGHTSPVFCKFSFFSFNINSIGVFLVGFSWLSYVYSCVMVMALSWYYWACISNWSRYTWLVFIGYSRIFDFHHHWNDVLVGGIVGSLVAFVSFKFILNWRHYSPRFLPYTISDKTETKPSSIDRDIPINTLSGMHRIRLNNDLEVNRFSRNYYGRDHNFAEQDHQF